MFLPLPPAPAVTTTATTANTTSGDSRGTNNDPIPYTHYLLGVTPGLGKGVAALGVYNETARTFSNSTGPPPAASLHPVGTHAHAQHRSNSRQLDDDSSSTEHSSSGGGGHTDNIGVDDAIGTGGCVACGERADGTRVCCADLAAGYRKATYDAGNVFFGKEGNALLLCNLYLRRYLYVVVRACVRACVRASFCAVCVCGCGQEPNSRSMVVDLRNSKQGKFGATRKRTEHFGLRGQSLAMC